MYDITARCTNDEDFEMVFVIVDDDDELRDITDFTFEFTLNDKDSNYGRLDQDSTGVTVTKDLDESSVTILILESALNGLECGNYRIACRYVDGDDRTKQLFKGTLALEEGEFNT
jgi:hypothetical protein